MKKITIVMILSLVSLYSFSQLSTQIGLGVSIYRAPVADLSVQYKINPIFFQIGYDIHIDREIKHGKYINGGIGAHIKKQTLFFEPYVGYSFIVRSSDKTGLNSQAMIYGASVGKNINDGAVLLKTLYCDGVYFAIISLRYNF